MSVQIRNFNTDFTRLLDEKIRHVVKVVTSTGIVECSGVILSQHSDVMKKMIESDEEIFLDDYTFVKDCLRILHGGNVALSQENCEEIMKFAVQFGIQDIIEQGLDFIESKVSQTNLIDYVNMCWNIKKTSIFYSADILDIDLFWPCEKTISNLGSDGITTLFEGLQQDAGERICSMFTNKVIAKTLLKRSTELIDESNVIKILETVREFDADFIEAVVVCPKADVVTFFEAFEKISLSAKHSKIVLNLKKSIFREIGFANFVTPNVKEVLKSWKGYDKSDILHLCSIKNADVYVLEVLISWVTFNKPGLKVVKQLFTAIINGVTVTTQYRSHLINIYRNLGYDVSNVYRGSVSDRYSYYLTQYHLIEKVSGTWNDLIYTSPTHSGDAKRKVIFFKCTYGCTNRTVDTKCKKSQITIDVVNGIRFQCYSDDDGRVLVETEDKRFLYGRTYDGRHVPFYTDIETALTMLCDPASLRVMRLK